MTPRLPSSMTLRRATIPPWCAARTRPASAWWRSITFRNYSRPGARRAAFRSARLAAWPSLPLTNQLQHMRSYSSLKGGFLIPRMALATCLFLGATYIAFYSFAGSFSPNAANAQPPFPVVENKVTNGGLTLLAKVFSPRGKVAPGETFPLVLTYQADGTGAANVNITVTLHSASLFQTSTPAASSGNGTAGSPLVYTIPVVAPNAAGQIVIEARAKSLAEDPEIIWKDLSADVTLATGVQAALPARTHGPKVT